MAKLDFVFTGGNRGEQSRTGRHVFFTEGSPPFPPVNPIRLEVWS